MSIFAVVAISGHEHIDGVVPQQFPERCHFVASGHWLVSVLATSQEVAKRVGLAPGATAATGIVYGVVGYYGLANPQVWEWLTAQATGNNLPFPGIPPAAKGLLGG